MLVNTSPGRQIMHLMGKGGKFNEPQGENLMRGNLRGGKSTYTIHKIYLSKLNTTATKYTYRRV